MSERVSLEITRLNLHDLKFEATADIDSASLAEGEVVDLRLPPIPRRMKGRVVSTDPLVVQPLMGPLNEHGDEICPECEQPLGRHP